MPESPAPVTVLHLLDCLNPGGTEHQLLAHLRALDRRRWRPLLGAFHEGGLLLPDVRALGVPVTEFPLRSSLAHPNTLVQIGRIVALCRRERVRILHAHDFYSNLVGVAAARLCGARVIASRRDLGHQLSPAKRRVLGLACRAADRVVVNARSIARLDGDGLAIPGAMLRMVPNGIDLARFDEEAAREPSPPVDALATDEDRARTVAVVSNMNLPDKGQDDLLAAVALLAADGLALRVLLVGDGPRRPLLERRAVELGLADVVTMVGRRADVPRLLARVGVACQPSWAEGFPNAVMEAMAASRPVVATAVGGCPELVDDGASGLLVPPRDPARLAAVLARVFADPAAARAMGRRARESVARRFTLESAVAVVDSLYRELCEGGAP